MIQDSEFLSQLRQLEMIFKPLRNAQRPGLHPLLHRGRSLDFTEYREYRQGDDPKDLDWKLYARSDRFFVKLRDTHTPSKVLILIDDSASMDYASPQSLLSKYECGLLTAFGMICLLFKQGDSFSIEPFFKEGHPTRPRSSRRAFNHQTQTLLQLQAHGAQGRGKPRLSPHAPFSFDHLFIISDFLVESTLWREWLQHARWISGEVTCLQVADPDEVSPHHYTSLRDAENPNRLIAPSAKEFKQYELNYQKHLEQLSHYCKENRIRLEAVDTAVPLSRTIRKIFSDKRSG